MIIYDADITGSLKVNGSDFNLSSISSSIVTNSSSIASLESVSGSYANSASFASDISTNSASIASLETVSGSYANSSSFASDISANSSSIASLETVSGSYANSSSFASDISANSASIGSLNAVSSSYLLNTTDTLTGDLTVTGNIIATTLNVQDVTASVVYSSGSNIFGSSSIDTQQFTGSILTSGSIEVNGDKFTVAGATGNTEVAGNLGVDLVLTVGNNLRVTGAGNANDPFLTPANDTNTGIYFPGSGKIGIGGTGGLEVENNGTFGGNVGIGTDNPQVPLQIGTHLTTAPADTGLCVSNRKSIRINDSDGSYNFGVYIKQNYSGSSYLILGTRHNGADTDALFVKSGNVGIGNTNPSNPLTLYKNASQGNPSSHTPANASLKIEDNANTMYLDGNSIVATGTAAFTMGNTAAADLIMYTNAVERMRIDSSGISKFTSADQTVAEFNSTATDGPFNVYRANGTTLGYVGNAQGIMNGGTTNFGIRAQSDFVISTNGATERMRIDSSGRVGIGVTPSYTNVPLHTKRLGGGDAFNLFEGDSAWVFGEVDQAGTKYCQVAGRYGSHSGINVTTAGDVKIGGYDVENPASIDRVLEISAASAVGLILNDTRDTHPMYVANEGAVLNFKYNTYNMMTVSPDGNNNIVIIKAKPSTYNSVAILSLYGTNSSTYGGSVVVRSSILSSTDGTAFGANLIFKTNDTSNVEQERMTIDSNGNVGIGKSPTDKKLELYSTGNTALRIQNSTTGTGSNDGLLIETGISNGDAIIWNYESADIKFGTSGTERLRIDSSGNLIQFEGNVQNHITSDSNGFNFIANANATNVGRSIIFKSSTSGGAVTERMRITSDGSLARNSKKVWNFTAVKSFTEGGSSDNFFRLNFTGNQAVLANITLMSNNSGTGSRTMQSVQAMLAVSYQGYLPTMTEITKTAVSNNGSSYISAVQGANGSLTFLCDTTNNTTGTSNTTFVSVELISNGAIDASITVL